MALTLVRLHVLKRMMSRYSSLHQRYAEIANDYIFDVFWRRWIREYLRDLQARQKWQRAKSDICSGDVILVADENIPRVQWPLGKSYSCKCVSR